MENQERLISRIEESLELETIENGTYRSKKLWKPTGARGVFGGQIIAQGLAAASKSVPLHFKVHSLHSYFILKGWFCFVTLEGDCRVPIIYRVYPTRDGRSFVTRSVSARQNGKQIFTMMISFQVHEESPLEHQYSMPQVLPPEQVPTDKERMKKWLLETPNLPVPFQDYLRLKIEEPLPIEFKPLESMDLKRLLRPDKSFKQCVWMRAQGQLPDDPAFHHCAAAYASDHYLLASANLPHGINYFTRPLRVTMMASLDHTMWFHRPFRMDDWLLFEMESTSSGSGRGLTFGKMYTRDGTLVLSCAQEGVIRMGQVPYKSLKEESINYEREEAKAKGKL